MKNLFKNLMLVAVAAMAFTACQKDNNEVNNVAKESTIEFTAGFDASRSQFGEMTEGAYPSFWKGGEYVLVDLVATNGETSTTAYMEKVDEAGATANFSVTFIGDYNDGTITVYSPYNHSADLSGWRDADYDGVMDPNIPATQTPDANSVEARAHILKAEHTFVGALTSGYVDLTFEHAVAYAKMTLNLGDVVALEDIASVRVVFGEQAYTLLPDNLDEPTFWFACKEAEVETMTITITDTADATYVREITTTEEKPLAFVTGQVSKFTVGGFEYEELEQVTDISASYDSWNGKYSFTIDHVSGARIWLTLYAEADGGLLPEDEFEYYDYCGYMYADYANWADYRNLEEYWIEVAHLDEGYEICFYFIDETGDEWEFTYSGVISGICNPPVPEAEAVEAVAETVSASGSSRYYTFAFEAGNYAFSNFWVDTEVEGLVIAEGEYSTDQAVVAYLDEEGNATGWEFAAEGTVTVEHDTENQEYILTFELEDTNGSTFTVTYVGEVEGVYAPGAATPLDAPEFDWEAKSATPTTMTVVWYAVDGAASYELYYTYYTDSQQTSETVTTTATTYTFEGLTQGMYYTVYIKALPASEANLESETNSISVETPYDPATFEADYTITTDKFEDLGGMKLKFYNEAGDYFIVPFNPYATELAAGSYTNNYGYPYADPLTTYNGYNVEISGHEHYGYNFKFVVVEKDGDNYTITLATPNSNGEMVKCVFTGALEVAEAEALVFTSAVAEVKNSNWYYVTFTNENGDTLVTEFATVGDNFIKVGMWDYNNSYPNFTLGNSYFNGDFNASIKIDVTVDETAYHMEIMVGATQCVFDGTVEGLELPSGEVVTEYNYTMTEISAPSSYGDINIYAAEWTTGGQILSLCVNPLAGKSFEVATYTKSDLDLNYCAFYPVSYNSFSSYSNLGDVTVDIKAVDGAGNVTSATITLVIGDVTYNIAM